MYCKNCGCLLEDSQSVCTQCGTKRGEGTAFCPECGDKKAPDSILCTNCGFKFSDAGASAGESEQSSANDNKSNTEQSGSENLTDLQKNPTTAAETPVQPENSSAQVQQYGQPVQQNMPYQAQQPMQQNMPYQAQPPMQQNMPYQAQQPMQQQYPNTQMQQNQQYYPPAPQRKGYCRNCGGEIMQGQVGCTICGTKYGEGTKYCHHCGAEATAGAQICSNCGKSLKPPFSIGRYFKDLLQNFVSIIKAPDIFGSIARNIPNVLSLIIFIVMLFPVASHFYVSSYYGLSGYRIPLSTFSVSTVAGILYILAFVVAIALYEPFTRSFISKNSKLDRWSCLFVPALDFIGSLFLFLGYIIKINASENAYIFYAKYPGMALSITGWVVLALTVLSVVSGIIAFIRFAKAPSPVSAYQSQQNSSVINEVNNMPSSTPNTQNTNVQNQSDSSIYGNVPSSTPNTQNTDVQNQSDSSIYSNVPSSVPNTQNTDVQNGPSSSIYNNAPANNEQDNNK